MDWIQIPLSLATLVCQCSTALIATAAFVVAAIQLRRLKRQIKEAASQITTSLSVEHNWKMFEHSRELPNMLSAWADLNDENKGWAWRILLLNHLDLLKMAYEQNKDGVIDKDEFDSWKRRGKYWFHGMFIENANGEAVTGRTILKQILSRDESTYTDGFCNWLLESGILPVSP